MKLAEKRARGLALYRTRVTSTSFAFRGARVSERKVIGIDAVLEKAVRKLLKSYYDVWYRPGRICTFQDCLIVYRESIISTGSITQNHDNNNSKW